MQSTNKKVSNPTTVIIIIILALLAFGLKRCRHSKEIFPQQTVSVSEGEWRHHKIIYTNHARCRMECRDISEEEVEYVLANGIINEAKSKEDEEEADGHCPSYALEARTKDGQNVRIVFGACDNITKVITAIDLGVEHSCNCR